MSCYVSRTVVTGQPAASPEGQYPLSTRSDGSDESAVGPPRYPLTPAGPRRPWARLPRRWGSSEARWTGPRTGLLKQEYEAAGQEADAPPETCAQVELPR